jgi:transcription antitermination factor NusG
MVSSSSMPDIDRSLQVSLLPEAPLSRWYATYTCSRHEKCVAQQMESRAIKCFVPTYRSVRRWKDRRKELSLPLFPGYVFVNLEWRDRLKVLEIPGVVQILSFNGKPAELPDHEIEMLRRRFDRNMTIQPHPYLRKGCRVQVVSGPLAGLEGILVRRKDRCRLVLSIDLIMRSVSVEVDEGDVEPGASR